MSINNYILLGEYIIGKGLVMKGFNLESYLLIKIALLRCDRKPSQSKRKELKEAVASLLNVQAEMLANHL